MKAVVIDTNCLLQITPYFSEYRFIWNKVVNGEIAMCISTEIINEYIEVLTTNTSTEFARTIVDVILSLPSTIRVEPTYRFRLITKDNDDNKFVDCAIVGNAELIVSDDKHFNILEKIPFPKVKVMRLEKFALYIKNPKGKA